MHTTLQRKIKDKKAKICVMGLGYVGLPTAILFAEHGFQVSGIDIDETKVNSINKGISPISDLKTNDRLKKVVQSKRLHSTTDSSGALSESDIIIITVPTPITPSKKPDLNYIISAVNDVSKVLRKDQLVILESTTFPGTTEEIVKPILERSGLKAGVDFGLAYCPERYNPGDSVHTFENVVRIVGGVSPKWGKITQELYQTIMKERVIVVRNMKTAEATKIVENIQRDLNIGLMNELALIFERMGIDIIDVIKAASTKWNFVRYNPGPGVGGHCLPVNPYYLAHKAEELGYHPRVILAGRLINDYMPKHVVDLAIDGLNEKKKLAKGSKIAILGIAYKANTDDVRGSPAKLIIKTLKEMGANVTIFDPYVSDENCQKVFGLKNRSLEQALKNADCTILVTDHNQFKKLSVDKISGCVNPGSVFVDTRHVFDPKEIKEHGLVYRGVGRGVYNH